MPESSLWPWISLIADKFNDVGSFFEGYYINLNDQYNIKDIF
jgi:hypothetical protein